MANDFQGFYKGIRLKPVDSTPALPGAPEDASYNVEGALWVYQNKIKAYVEAAVREVVTTDQTQTLSSKTLDAALIESSAGGSLDVDTVDATLDLAASAATINIGKLDSTTVIKGDLTVEGDVTTVNTSTLDVEDTNVTLNKGGDDASSEGSGLTVERTGTDGSIVYEDALTSKFKVGALGSEAEIATVSDSQNLTNKTLTSPVIDTQVTGSAISTDALFASASDLTLSSSLAIKTYVDAHINLATDAHDASAISVDNTNANITGTDVQTVLEDNADAIAGNSSAIAAINEDSDRIEVSQTAHGFVVGDAIHSGLVGAVNNFSLSQSDTNTTFVPATDVSTLRFAFRYQTGASAESLTSFTAGIGIMSDTSGTLKPDSGEMVAEIWSDFSGTDPLAPVFTGVSSNVSFTEFQADGNFFAINDKTWTFSGVTLDASTTYWVVLKYQNYVGATNFGMPLRFDNGSTANAHLTKYSFDSGASYTPGTSPYKISITTQTNEIGWSKSQADDAATLPSHVVTENTNVNNFVAHKFATVNVPSHGFTVGTQYFTDTATAGTPTATEPTSGFSAPLFKALDANTLFVNVHRAKDFVAEDHINDTVGAHAATAISVDDTNVNFTGVTVQAALDDIANTAVASGSTADDHINDTTDAHAASAITNTPAGDIAAITVQAAINELDTEKVSLNKTETISGDKTFNDDIKLYDTDDTFGTLKGDTTINSVVLESEGTNNTRIATKFTGGTGNSGSVTIASGNAIAGVDNSGDVTIETGTSAGGTRGNVNINAPSVLINSDEAVTESKAQTLTNKTFDANGTGNNISNIEVDDLAAGVLDTDLTTVSALDDTLASAKAIKAAIEAVPTGGAGSDTDAIHDNVAGEIAAITEKVAPVSTDFLLIEDSEDATVNSKKRIQIGNLPTGSSSLNGLTDVDTTGVSDGDSLVFNNSSGNWEPSAITSGQTSFTDAEFEITDSAASGSKLVFDLDATGVGPTPTSIEHGLGATSDFRSIHSLANPNVFTGQTFTIGPEDQTVTQVSFKPFNDQSGGNTTGFFTAEIYAVDGSDKPTGPVLATTSSIDISLITETTPGTAIFRDYPLVSSVVLSANTKYILYFPANTVTKDSGLAGVSGYSGGDWYFENEPGFSWQTAGDVAFKITGTAGASEAITTITNNITANRTITLPDSNVDLGDIATNNAKVSNATHTGEVTGSTTLTLDSTAVSNKSSNSSLAGTEEILINNGGTLEKTTAQNIADLSAPQTSFTDAEFEVTDSAASGSKLLFDLDGTPPTTPESIVNDPAVTQIFRSINQTPAPNFLTGQSFTTTGTAFTCNSISIKPFNNGGTVTGSFRVSLYAYDPVNFTVTGPRLGRTGLIDITGVSATNETDAIFIDYPLESNVSLSANTQYAFYFEDSTISADTGVAGHNESASNYTGGKQFFTVDGSNWQEATVDLFFKIEGFTGAADVTTTITNNITANRTITLPDSDVDLGDIAALKEKRALDIFKAEDFETTVAADLTTGRSGIFDGGAFIFAGAVTDEIVSPISGTRSIKYTTNATPGSSDNDYVYFTQTIEDKQKGQDVGINLYYTWNGSDDLIEVVIYDDTNDVVLTSSLDKLKAASDPTRFSTNAFIPTGCNAIKVGFHHTGTSEASKELVFDDVELTLNPFSYKNLIDTQMYTLEQGNSSVTYGGDTLEFNLATATITETGPEIITVSSGTNRTEFTANRKCVVTMAHAGHVGNQYRQCAIAVVKSSGTVYFHGSQAPVANSVSSVTAEFELEAGDYFYLQTAVDNSSATSGGYYTGASQPHRVVFTAEAETEHVVTPAKDSVEYGTFIEVNGSGSTNTYIPNYLTQKENVSGNLVSVVYTDATDGASITALKDCVVIASTSTSITSTTSVGFTLNGNNLAAAIQDQNNDTIVSLDYSDVAQTGASSSCTVYMKAGDVLRPHLSVTSPVESSNGSSSFSFTAMPISSNYLAAVPVEKVAYLKDVKSSGVAGGGFTGGSYLTRTLNTVEGDSEIVTLSSNQFTLGAGKYHIEFDAPAYSEINGSIGNHKAKLRNITDGTDEILGSSERLVRISTASVASNRSFGKGLVELTTSKTFEIQHRCTTTHSTNSLGHPASFGDNEIYTQVTIRKLK